MGIGLEKRVSDINMLIDCAISYDYNAIILFILQVIVVEI